jgi:Beta-ketoacyl synthase, N-terminal domain
MKIALEIQSCASIWDKRHIEELNEKIIVPNPIARRRLTRTAKILLYLANRVNFEGGKIVFGTEFGECAATVEIISSILQNKTISPTAFQNSVHNTAASYLSIHSENKNEILTVSDFGSSSISAIKVAAIKALTGNTILVACVDSLDFPQIDEMNSCGLKFLECGSALVVRVTNKTPDIVLQNKQFDGFLTGYFAMLELCEHFEDGKRVFEVQI